MKYRSEIDGLRAIAVVPVILFHAGFELFGGGYVGVDIFFVVSGYLITTIIIEDIENNRFSIINFYERRARRILPALFLVMSVSIPFALMWMTPSQMKEFSQSIVAISLFLSNIQFWRETNYFSNNTDEIPFLHTWSLAVEEQFYFLFPIFLILVWRFGKKNVFWIIVVIALISLALSELGWRKDASANFYLAPTRAWELLAGSISSFIVQRQGIQKNNLLSFIGLSLIIYSIFEYNYSTPFPSLYTTLPVLGTLLIILFANKGTFVSQILCNKFIVGVGLISYSAYLWHHILFAFLRIRLIETPQITWMFALSIVTFVISYLSWRFVEKPFKNNIKVSRTLIFGISICGIIIFTSFGLIGHFYSKNFEKIWLDRQSLSVKNMYAILSKSHPSFNNWGSSSEDTQEISSCIFNVRELDDLIESKILNCSQQYGKGVLVLGDSHAIDLFGVIASRREHPFLIGITKGGCRLHDNHNNCHYNRVFNFINSNQKIFQTLIYEQAGFYLLQKKNGTKGSRGMFSDLSFNEPVNDVVLDRERIGLTLEFLFSISEIIKVKWFLPRAEPHIPINLVLKKGCDYQYSYRPNQYEIFEGLDRYIIELARHKFEGHVDPISQNKMFDINFPRDFISCNTIYWSDGDHLSSSGEVHFGKRIKPELFE